MTTENSSQFSLPTIIDRDWIFEERDPVVEVTPGLIEEMQEFCLSKWKERAEERGLKEPKDLSYACKFTSLFVREVIGGYISGNEKHQFVVVDDEVVDINEGAEDVRKLDDPHLEDFGFIGNPDHLDSLESCLPRVQSWLNEFFENRATPLPRM